MSEEQKLVFMLNECDIVFKEVDKMTRNSILDKVNDNPQKYVMILTTNLKLEDMFEEDPSLVRSGRMIKLEVTDDCSEVRMVSDDMLKERLRRRQLKRDAFNETCEDMAPCSQTTLDCVE